VSKATIESDGKDAFVVYNSVRMAKRGQPNSPEAGTWVSLEPGFRVTYKGYPAELVIERDIIFLLYCLAAHAIHLERHGSSRAR
jgi:hypothetical protein